MDKLSLNLPFGDQIKKVEISTPFGAGKVYYQVFVDHFYKGRIEKKDGIWQSMDLSDMFTAEDIQMMGELIDKGDQT